MSIKEKSQPSPLKITIENYVSPNLDIPIGYRLNILAICKEKISAKPLWSMPHIDAVPIGEIELWKGHPHKAWAEEIRICGRGVRRESTMASKNPVLSAAKPDHRP